MVYLTQSEIDYDTLEQGDYISPETLCEVLECEPGTQEYAFALMALRDDIEAAMSKRLGYEVSVKTELSGLRVMTDSEATQYHNNRQHLQRQAQLRSFRKQSGVNEENLSAEERAAHSRNVVVNSRFIQAQNEVKKEIRLIPHKRTTPGLSTYKPKDGEAA